MRERLIEFVQRLRRSGIRISIAESLDATRAIEAAGIEPEVFREALSATLIKDEAERALFLELFAEYFAAPPLPGGSGGRRRRKPGQPAGSGDGHGRTGQAAPSAGGMGGIGSTPERSASVAAPPTQRAAAPPIEDASSRPGRTDTAASDPRRYDVTPKKAARGDHDRTRRSKTQRPAEAVPAEREDAASAAAPRPGATAAAPGPAAVRARRVADLVRRPFRDMSEHEVDEAREAARELGRRFEARWSRREVQRRRGRPDFRRTIRASLAHGGAMIDVKYRGRRPGRPRLIALCDVSWSVSRASELLLAILAGAQGAFTGIERFAFVDRLVGVDYLSGHLAPEGPIDLHARSDHGAVLCELETRHADAIDRSTVLLVLADARSNRRPARADALRRLAGRARAVVWAVPESRERWNTGDSALAAYSPWCDLVVEATSLGGLMRALRAVER